MPNDDDLMSVAEVAAFCGKSVRTVHRLIQSGELVPAMKVSGGTGPYLFRRATVEAVFAAQRSAAAS